MVHYYSRSKQCLLARIRKLLLKLQWIAELQEYSCILALSKCIKSGHRRLQPLSQLIQSKTQNLKEDLLQDFPNLNHRFQVKERGYTQNQQDFMQLKQEKKILFQKLTSCWNTTQKSTGMPMGYILLDAHPFVK